MIDISKEIEAAWGLGHEYAWQAIIRLGGDLLAFVAEEEPFQHLDSPLGEALRRGWFAGRVSVIDALLPDRMAFGEFAELPDRESRLYVARERFMEWAARSDEPQRAVMGEAIFG